MLITENVLDKLQISEDVDGIVDDYSSHFMLVRSKLIGKNGTRYIEFVRTLKRKRSVIYRDISIGYLCLVLSLCLTALLPTYGLHPIIAVIGGMVLIGYWVAYLALFLHEAAHYNLANTKINSDRIATYFIAWIVGADISTYRPIHFQHHRELGTINDSEFTYFFPLNLLFLFKAAFGVRVIEVLLFRKQKTNLPSTKQSRRPMVGIVAGLAIHSMTMLLCISLGFWWAALAWLIGIGLFFPFFAALRQLLEHRNDQADPRTNYRLHEHGAFTRLFGNDVLSSTFGGAGFNRHLLHHWEPQVSYTNLAEMEAFLAETQLCTIIQMRRTTYFNTFWRLFKW